MFLKLFLCLAVVSAAHGWQYMQDWIPNGRNVPNPHNPNELWLGVGHTAALGDGARNKFGIAFKNAGSTWTDALCRADTDKDGKTNGEELGDPDCVWTRGATPARTTEITHPGICDPVDSAVCQGTADNQNNPQTNTGEEGEEGEDSEENHEEDVENTGPGNPHADPTGSATSQTFSVLVIVYSISLISIYNFYLY